MAASSRSAGRALPVACCLMSGEAGRSGRARGGVASPFVRRTSQHATTFISQPPAPTTERGGAAWLGGCDERVRGRPRVASLAPRSSCIMIAQPPASQPPFLFFFLLSCFLPSSEAGCNGCIIVTTTTPSQQPRAPHHHNMTTIGRRILRSQ